MSLESERSAIDQIDARIVDLLRQRAETVIEIGRIKGAAGRAVYDPAREADLLRRLTSGDIAPLSETAVAAIYRQIISASRELQRPLRVACLGPEHTFSHLAAVRYFGDAAEITTEQSIDDVFAAVERDAADYGIVPVENSIHGVEARTLDNLFERGLLICAETCVAVHHNLVANCQIEQIEAVHSHPQALAQCREWLCAHVPKADLVHEPSTAAAARLVSQTPNHAAIATAAAADANKLQILAANIEDQPNNQTRFFAIGNHSAAPTGRDKTSLIFTTEHRPGALYHALKPFSEYNIDLTLIQSRPARGVTQGPYYFYIDFDGHIDTAPTVTAVEVLRERCTFVKILGSYPATA